VELLKWKEPLGKEDCPYCYRWVVNLGLFSIHHWVRSDDTRAYHNHPYWFITLILKGKYLDVTDKGTEELSRGSIRFRKASHTHTVVIPTGSECWSLLLTGPKINKWGFFHGGRFFRSEKYFKRFGKHPCSQ
jgi:hypothetical protein